MHSVISRKNINEGLVFIVYFDLVLVFVSEAKFFFSNDFLPCFVFSMVGFDDFTDDDTVCVSFSFHGC